MTGSSQRSNKLGEYIRKSTFGNTDLTDAQISEEGVLVNGFIQFDPLATIFDNGVITVRNRRWVVELTGSQRIQG